MLGVLGVARTHQHHFTLFLTVVIGLSALTVAVFLLTAPREAKAGPSAHPTR